MLFYNTERGRGIGVKFLVFFVALSENKPPLEVVESKALAS
jgi:hypothetical protein